MPSRIRVSGTVGTVSSEMAMVKPDPKAPISERAMMIEAASQFNGMPLDRFLTPGMPISGEWDPNLLRFFPDFDTWSEAQFFEAYPVGTVVLALVADVTRQIAHVYLHPTLTIEMKREDVSTNPKDVIDHLWKKGDIVTVRVVRDPNGRLKLRHHDIDDDEPVADAPSVMLGGEPWLTQSQMDLIVSTKELWERERQEAEAFTKALDVLAKKMQLDIDELEKTLGSIGTETGGNAVVDPNASESVQERSLRDFTAAQIRRILANYKVEMEKLSEHNRRLSQALEAKSRRESDLTDQVADLRAQLSRARQAVQDAGKLDHSGVSGPLTIADRRVRFATPEEWIAEEIRAFWIENYTPADRVRFPLDAMRWSVLPSFCDTFHKLDDDGMDKAIRAATHIVTTRRAVENMFESHPLREGDESSRPEVTRADGAVAQRAYIESHTAQARRLHYWKLRDGSIELSRVGLHDDFTP